MRYEYLQAIIIIRSFERDIHVRQVSVRNLWSERYIDISLNKIYVMKFDKTFFVIFIVVIILLNTQKILASSVTVSETPKNNKKLPKN